MCRAACYLPGTFFWGRAIPATPGRAGVFTGLVVLGVAVSGLGFGSDATVGSDPRQGGRMPERVIPPIPASVGCCGASSREGCVRPPCPCNQEPAFKDSDTADAREDQERERHA